MTPSKSLLLKLRVTNGTQRLDQALLQEIKKLQPGFSRKQLKALFDERKILLKGAPRSPAWELWLGTYEIEIRDWAEPQQLLAKPSRLGSFLPIVHEDQDLLVLNKQSGVPSMPHLADETETAVGSALAHFPELTGVGRGGLEPGLLHRLDTGTSGLLVFAKTREAYLHFHQAWKTAQIRKTYRAIVHGNMSDTHFPEILRLTLAHHPESRKRMIVIDPSTPSRKFRGKPLPTLTHLLRKHDQFEYQNQFLSDIEIEIKTGVMHQIRCTLAHLGHPVAGDPIYTPASLKQLSFPRLFLHAWKLRLPLRSGQTLELTAELPSEFLGLEGW